MIDEKFVAPQKLKYLTYGMIAIGVISFVIGFFTDSTRTWANYLLNNFYFVSIAVGAAFFLSNSVHCSSRLVCCL